MYGWISEGTGQDKGAEWNHSCIHHVGPGKVTDYSKRVASIIDYNSTGLFFGNARVRSAQSKPVRQSFRLVCESIGRDSVRRA